LRDKDINYNNNSNPNNLNSIDRSENINQSQLFTPKTKRVDPRNSVSTVISHGDKIQSLNNTTSNMDFNNPDNNINTGTNVWTFKDLQVVEDKQ